jgi:hypothetical protein
MVNSTTDEISLLDQSNEFKPISKIQKCSKYSIAKLLIIIVLIIVTSLSYQRAVYHKTKTESQKVLIAHCMAGAPRTLYKEEVYVAYGRQTLNILPGDLFIVFQLFNKSEVIHGTTIAALPPDKYNAAIKYLSPRRIEWISSDNHLGAIEDRTGYSRWQRCLELIEQTEKENGVKYDFIVRSRPDLYFAKDLPTSNLLPKDRILINPYYECLHDIPSGYNQTWTHIGYLCDAKEYGISDIFAIIPRALADPYMRAGYIPNLPRHVCGSRSDHPECAIKAALFKANITFEVWPFVVKLMRSAEFCHAQGWNRFNSWC